MSDPGPDAAEAEIDRVLGLLGDGVRNVLGENFVGLYLYGSRATGDFDAETSDLDFLIVTEGEVPPGKVPELEAVHRRLATSGLKWAEKLEGTYIPLASLRRYYADDPPRPQVNERQFYMAQQGVDWVLQRQVLREHPVVVVGPSLVPWIDPVSADDIREAVRANLELWWAPMLNEPERLVSDEYQAYAVLTMCRSLFAVKTGLIGTKRSAADWALAELPARFRPLIRTAASWRPGAKMDARNEVLSLIDYADVASRA